MLAKKKIALLTVALMVMLAGGVYAGMRLSNILTANWVVKESQTNLVLSWPYDEPSGDLNRGQWYSTYVRLQNTGATTYTVIVKFKVWIATSLPDGSITIQGWYSDDWHNIATYQWDSDLGRYVYVGTWGPSEGFQCTPGWDVISEFRFKFESNAPIDTPYYFEAWVEQVP
jgi:hypothetical protein